MARHAVDLEADEPDDHGDHGDAKVALREAVFDVNMNISSLVSICT